MFSKVKCDCSSLLLSGVCASCPLSRPFGLSPFKCMKIVRFRETCIPNLIIIHNQELSMDSTEETMVMIFLEILLRTFPMVSLKRVPINIYTRQLHIYHQPNFKP